MFVKTRDVTYEYKDAVSKEQPACHNRTTQSSVLETKIDLFGRENLCVAMQKCLETKIDVFVHENPCFAIRKLKIETTSLNQLIL